MPKRDQLVLLGINHHVAGVETRERVVFTAATLPRALTTLSSMNSVRECLILSTCNRTELYVILHTDPAEPSSGRALLTDFIAGFHGLELQDVEPCLYYATELDVVRHVFRVSSGLDSMVLGEVEILGQVRTAFQFAQREGVLGKWLSTLFRHALQTGKRARSETGISHNAASVSYAAVALARRLLPDLASAQVLLVGAGATAELVARTLVAHGVEGIVIINRTAAHAERLAEAMHGISATFEDLLPMLVATDIVVTSTDAPHALITAASVARILPARRGRPLLLIDLAVPRDVEPAVGALDGVHVSNLDDLEAFVSTTMQLRVEESSKVDAIIVEEVERFAAWQSSRKVVSTISGLQQRAEEVRRAELDKVSGRLSHLSPEERAAVEAATRAIVNKMLHHPISLLKESAATGDDSCIQTVRALFDLNVEAAGSRDV